MEWLDSVWEWYSAAIEDSQEGRWVRDDAERQVLADVVAATNPLHDYRLPPFSGESWNVRLARIATWAAVVRLAARAGGWTLHPVAGHHPQRPAGMAELLSALYAVGEQGETWLTQLPNGETPPARAVAQAEGFLNGPGSVEDLALFFYD